MIIYIIIICGMYLLIKNIKKVSNFKKTILKKLLLKKYFNDKYCSACLSSMLNHFQNYIGGIIMGFAIDTSVNHSVCCHIIPPHMAERHRAHKLQKHGHDIQEAVDRHVNHSKTFRTERSRPVEVEHIGSTFSFGVVKKPKFHVYNASQQTELPGKIYDVNDSLKQSDPDAYNAITAAQKTYQFYHDIFAQNSVDNKGLDLNSTVHFDQKYDNAFWNGKQMVYGDGDGEVFGSFTENLDVIGHELTHGFTQHHSNLTYAKQSGALNEHLSDAFGLSVKHYDLALVAKSTGVVAEYDDIIGKGLILPYDGKTFAGLRSMANPGTAYVDHAVLGTDPQPGKMGDYKTLPTTDKGDNGGVHINSGIPNKALWSFHADLQTKKEGSGLLFEIPAHVWFDTAIHIKNDCDFRAFAKQTIASAANVKNYITKQGVDYFKVQESLRGAWQAVQVL
jgi:Zn-dependent metalloprotease